MKNPQDKTQDEWREELTPQQFSVCREHGTEPAFSGEYWDCHDYGVYRCVCCGTPLFDSETKYESGTGWPSFWEPVNKDALEYRDDDPLGMDRIEIVCSHCDAHLGHVFEDGPKPTGMRYCVNSTSLALDRK
ncbi:MAG: peptide-methionine (R)-S-oxide reductase MsrB [Sideroxydans sp.]|nr:peptide-methionine (R)-S-oxide reductase MsrB [Sideroxydans sp.]NOT99187.1 peptide-methionine (R)-S-oxide reductase MsrB [Sideroxydans sp.]